MQWCSLVTVLYLQYTLYKPAKKKKNTKASEYAKVKTEFLENV
jgi:hypothetical protein